MVLAPYGRMGSAVGLARFTIVLGKISVRPFGGNSGFLTSRVREKSKKT